MMQMMSQKRYLINRLLLLGTPPVEKPPFLSNINLDADPPVDSEGELEIVGDISHETGYTVFAEGASVAHVENHEKAEGAPFIMKIEFLPDDPMPVAAFGIICAFINDTMDGFGIVYDSSGVLGGSVGDIYLINTTGGFWISKLCSKPTTFTTIKITQTATSLITSVDHVESESFTLIAAMSSTRFHVGGLGDYKTSMKAKSAYLRVNK